ncbi:MAG TPA: CBS domain-containing protein [Thermoanaerobaculia bacterium]|jgi:CBS domain-containing protein|nr:CBS domain-containing protein [Thermoanaerobaculia bacterium]
MKQIGELITGQTLTVLEPGTDVRTAAQRMSEVNIGAAAVVESGRLAGIFSERDIMARVVAKGLDPSGTTVGLVMSKELVVAESTENVDSALQKMHSIRARHLPVVDDGKLVGMISIRDLLEMDDEQQRAKATFLNELVTYSPDYES